MTEKVIKDTAPPLAFIVQIFVVFLCRKQGIKKC